MAIEVVTGISWFIPIFSFFLVFIICYALLKKSGLLTGDAMPLMISFILASFFILQANLVDYVQFLAGWVGVVAVVIFFLFVLIAFGAWGDGLDILKKKQWFSWGFVILMLILLLISTAYVFDWAIDWAMTWGKINTWVNSDWFGFILLLALGFAAYGFIKNGSKK